MTGGRVLWINWRDLDNPQGGGAEVHAHEVLARLALRGWKCTLVCHRFTGGAARETHPAGYEIRRVGGANTFNFTVYANLRRWIRETRSEIVVDDSNKIVFAAPWLSSVPVVGLIHHLFGKAIHREASLPAALYVRLSEAMVPWIYRKTPVMTGSPSAKAELSGLGIREVIDVGEGVDLAGYGLPEPGQRDPNLLLYLGRVKKYKGLDVLIQALHLIKDRFPSARLEVAGSGDDSPRLRSVADCLGIGDRVRFLGRVSEAEKISLYRRASVALNSSLKEGWGLTSIEANGCGTPVIASDVPGLCDSVRDGATGYLVPFGDAAAMADRIARVLGDPILATKLQQQSLEWARSHTWDKVADRTEEVLLRSLPRR
ncbi:MAG: glycosyltransferase family 4 protein [Fibrobacteres bacterium]|nr:glycosyltransferase family 4 protein [Fibrobacterota bacterium]